MTDSQNLTPAAEAFGRMVARQLFAGRTGHGGGPCSYRQMREAEIVALAGIAFDAGRLSEAGRPLNRAETLDRFIARRRQDGRGPDAKASTRPA